MSAILPTSPATLVRPEAAVSRVRRRPVAVVCSPTPAELPTTVLEPATGWRLLNLRELWRYRELLYFLVWRDVKVRYKQTVLGAAWAVLQPAMMMLVFTVCLSWMAGVPSGDCPYPLFAYLGFLPWSFFSAAIGNAATSVVGSERLITKIYFPRLAIPFAAVGAASVDFAIAFGLQLALMLAYGVAPGPSLVLLPIIWVLLLMTALGVGALLAALTVQYRDFRHVIPFLVQFWMFATPTIYLQTVTSSGGWLGDVLALNPLTGLIQAYRAASLGEAVVWGQAGVSALVALVTLALGCFYFRRVEDSFPDII
jgi:lipopolysaccharide transport system permease protein